MKRNHTRNLVFFILMLGAFTFASCSDNEYDRDKGPSDIRIENISSEVYDSIQVNTSGGEHFYGSLSPGAQSDYKRFDFAYPEADITLYINSVKYTYGPVNYTYAVWLGKGKFTYQVDIESEVTHTLSIEVIADAPLD